MEKTAIEQRILEEYRKYKALPNDEWAKIAAAKIYASQFRTEGASTVPTDEEVRKACPEDCLSDWILGAKWMREKMLKAKGAEDKRPLDKFKGSTMEILVKKDNEITRLQKELEELKAENERLIKLWASQEVELTSLKTLHPNNTLSKEKLRMIFIKHGFVSTRDVASAHNLNCERLIEEICSLPNAATSAEAVKKAVEALEEMLYDVSINAHMTSKINKALSLLKQSNHQ